MEMEKEVNPAFQYMIQVGYGMVDVPRGAFSV
jgi:hypothetical protein